GAQAAEGHAEPASARFAQGTTFRDHYKQLAVSGISRHSGAVTEEFQRELQEDGGAKIYSEMAYHPVVAAVMFAIKMSLRRVNWWV
ncbi:MAG: hypothetical protein GWN58_10070, partial [Anaerolineae bacterium]|nr:hypothetical protein [Anaerolineae bacterium]